MNLDNTTAMEYWAVLAGMECGKMARAWRSRSGTTRGKWFKAARMLTGERDNERLASCLYVACGWYAMRCGSYTFDGVGISPRGWRVIKAMTADFVAMKPAKAMGRGEWEARGSGGQAEDDAMSDWNMKA
jgi:hypothetical protein